jgi:hypothetical protein
VNKATRGQYVRAHASAGSKPCDAWPNEKEKKMEEEEESGIPLPLVEWQYDATAASNLAGILLIPRISGFRQPIGTVRMAVGVVDRFHGTSFTQYVPNVIADDEAFQRTAQHFRREGGSLLRVPMPANRNPRYTWAETVLDATSEMVSLSGQSWLEFQRNPKDRRVGDVYYSSAADGHIMAPEIVAEFTEAYERNKATLGTADAREILAAILRDLSAKLIGRNIWFIPTAGGKLGVFADVMNQLNKLAGYSALVVFEIIKTAQNDVVAQNVITEVFKRQLEEAEEAVAEYMADIKAYNRDPKANKMRYKSRATRGFSDINILVREAEMYASILGAVAKEATNKAESLQRQWTSIYQGALIRDGQTGEALLVNDLCNK